MQNDLQAFYLRPDEPNRSCVQALRDRILGHHPSMGETVKYGMPCFTFENKPLCYLWIDKLSGEPYVLLVDGGMMQHAQLETGDRKRMKILRINPSKDLPLKTVNAVLDEAISLRLAKSTQN